MSTTTSPSIFSRFFTRAFAANRAGLETATPKCACASRTNSVFTTPDAQVTCHPNPPDDSFQDNPVVVIEVISESTRRADEGEKRAGYLALPSVEVYLLVESGRPAVIAYRRTATGFVREVFTGLAAVIPLGGIGTELPLAEIYERVTLPAPETE